MERSATERAEPEFPAACFGPVSRLNFVASFGTNRTPAAKRRHLKARHGSAEKGKVEEFGSLRGRHLAAKRPSAHRFLKTSKIKLKSCTSVIPMVT